MRDFDIERTKKRQWVRKTPRNHSHTFFCFFFMVVQCIWMMWWRCTDSPLYLELFSNALSVIIVGVAVIVVAFHGIIWSFLLWRILFDIFLLFVFNWARSVVSNGTRFNENEKLKMLRCWDEVKKKAFFFCWFDIFSSAVIYDSVASVAICFHHFFFALHFSLSVPLVMILLIFMFLYIFSEFALTDGTSSLSLILGIEISVGAFSFEKNARQTQIKPLFTVNVKRMATT